MSLTIDYANTDPQPTIPNLPQTKQAGARAIIVRAIYGRGGGLHGCSRDPYWARDKDAILAAGLVRSAYTLVCMPRAGFTTPEPEEQGYAFIDYVGRDLNPTNPLNMVPVFDVEEQSSLDAHAYLDWITRFAMTIGDFYEAMPMMYSARHVWAEYVGGLPPGTLDGCPPNWIAKPWPWAERAPIHLDGAPTFQPYTIPAFGDDTYWMNYQYQGDATGCPGFASKMLVDVSRNNVVAQGAKGSFVRWVQQRVGAAVDGDFGPATAAAVKVFQAAHGLSPDGVCGIYTNACLTWVKPKS